MPKARWSSSILVAGRLKASKTTAAGTPDVSTSFAYDPTGANVSQISEKVGSGASQVKSRFEFDAFDRVSSQEKVTGDSEGPAEKTKYTYDGFDRRDSMIEETSGAPIKKANLSYVGTSDTLSLRERSNADGTGTKTTVGFDYDSGLDSLGMARRADGATTATYASFAKDANGSIEGLAGTAGAYNSRNAYDPYGNKQDAAEVPGQTQAMKDEANDQPFRFQGFYLDSGVKTYDMRARQYLPQAGRFLTQDRFESSQGDFNLVSDPLIQSRYAFAGGNPISNVEFDGHCPIKNRCPGTRKGTPGGRSKAPSSGGDREGSGGPNGDGRLNSGRRPVPAPPSSGTDRTSNNRLAEPVSQPRDDSDGSVGREAKPRPSAVTQAIRRDRRLQFAKGAFDSIAEGVDSLAHPRRTAKGLANAAKDPGKAAEAIADSCDGKTPAECGGYAAGSALGAKGAGAAVKGGAKAARGMTDSSRPWLQKGGQGLPEPRVKIPGWNTKEPSIRRWRFAPFGNQGGMRRPHYHRSVPDPNRPGQSLPGKGTGRHRPWQTSPLDNNWLDRF